MASYLVSITGFAQATIKCDNGGFVPILIVYCTWNGNPVTGDTYSVSSADGAAIRQVWAVSPTLCSMGMTSTNPNLVGWSVGELDAGPYTIVKNNFSEVGRRVSLRDKNTDNIIAGNYLSSSSSSAVSGNNVFYAPLILWVNKEENVILAVDGNALSNLELESVRNMPYVPVYENGVPCFVAPNSYRYEPGAINNLSWPATYPFDDTVIIPVKESFDPFYPGGESDTGGGEGNFDGTSVDVDFALLPTLSAVDTGFITLYNPTLAQLHSLADYMWSNLFDIDTLKKLFSDPMQAILGLSIVPGPVPSGVTQNVKIGNIDSGISMTKAASQYIDIDCGTLNVEEFWGAYLDYEPYTKAEIFLPFIGVHQISIDDIMNKPVHIKYHIDLLSGGCACEIKCGGSVLYTFIGSCAVSIPVTGSDWTNLINGVLSAASAIGTMVATGGSAAPAAISTLASTAVNSLKPSIEKSGSIAGAGGLLAGKVPVLILTRPRQALPNNQNKFTGYPSFITRSLGSLSGYTEVHSIRLSGIDGTEAEIDEIEELLKGGVIL